MFHSAECQMQCPITQQIKAKGPPPLPLRLIIEEVPRYTSRRKKRVCQRKERDTRARTRTHTHKGINTKGKEVEGLRRTLSLKPCLSISHRVPLLHQADTQRPLSAEVWPRWRIAALNISRMLISIKSKSCCGCLLITRAVGACNDRLRFLSNSESEKIKK